MPVYPLSTLSAQVNSQGITAPTYADVWESLKASYRAIYGSDIYIEPDSQDGQFIAVAAAAIYDSNQTAVSVFNGFNPNGAQGEALSSLVKINGITRKIATNSTVTLTIVGQVGTIINNGIAQDANGNQWLLPATVTIPVGATIDVTATAQNKGNIAAAANTINKIFTPTLGWQTVNNAAAATAGTAIETDAELRRRQTTSVSLPALSIINAIQAAIQNLDGVIEVLIYENTGDTTDGNGLPPHSISAVVNGGNILDIGKAIALRKPPGTATYGGTSTTVQDAMGRSVVVNFDSPTIVTIIVGVAVTALTGYVSTTGDKIKAAISDYISGLKIGQKIYLNKLYAPASLVGTGLESTFNVTAITIARSGDSLGSSDIALTYKEDAKTVASNVTLTVT